MHSCNIRVVGKANRMTGAIDNPWTKLTKYEGKYFAECDRASLERLSQINSAGKIVDLKGNGEELHEDTKLHLELLPEPFIGNPATAGFVFLAINPGFSEEDEVAFEFYRDAVRSNFGDENNRTMYWVDTDPTITPPGETRTYVNAPRKWYFGNPQNVQSEAGSVGTLQLLLFMLSYKGSFRKLHADLQNGGGLNPQDRDYWKAVRDEVLRNRCPEQAREIMRQHVAVVDLFPYHSKKANGLKDWMFRAEPSQGKLRTGLESRFYTKQMVEDALSSGARILVSRGCAKWFSLVPALLEYAETGQVFTAINPNNVPFTPNNVRKISKNTDINSNREWKMGEKDTTLFWNTVDHIFESWSESLTDSY